MLHLPERNFSYIISYSTAIFNKLEVADLKKKLATSIVLHRHIHIPSLPPDFATCKAEKVLIYSDF